MNIASTFVVTLFAISVSVTHAQNTATTPPSSIYLRCNIVNEPEGVNDVHIDFAKKIIVDYFGTSHPLREEGPFIISETFAEVNGKREVATTTRINRYTLSLQYMWPAQKIIKNSQCTVVEKKL